jgi:methylenetetrahydrofolate reductase (NADPH)
MDTYFLVNVVHNDFKDPQAIFQPFFKVGAGSGLRVQGDSKVAPQQAVKMN